MFLKNIECLETDTDFNGHDLNDKPSDDNYARGSGRRDSYHECQELCKLTAACNFFTWHSSDNDCYLKTSDVGRYTVVGHISALKNCGKNV